MSNYDQKHRYDLECLVLGTVLVDSGVHDDYQKHNFKPSDFIGPNLKEVHMGIMSTFQKGMKPDLHTVYNCRPPRFKQNSATQFMQTMIGLTQKIGSGAHFEQHCFMLKQYILMDYWNEVNRRNGDCDWETRDVLQVSENIVNGYEKIRQRLTAGFKVKEDLDPKEDLRQRVENRMKGITNGIPTGIQEFDAWCDGFQNRELITIAARPGMGKTTFCLAICLICMNNNIPIIFFTLEMSKIDIKQRLAANLTGIPLNKIRKADLNADEMHKVFSAYDQIDASSITIVDETIVYEDIVQKIKECEGVKIAIIDYVQLMVTRANTQDRRNEIGMITRGLKATANKYDIPVIQLAQLNRAVDGRPNKRPLLTDLKESGSIEEDSDTVGFLYRDAYYKKAENQGIVLTNKENGMMELNIAKGRNTGTGKFVCFLDFLNISVCSYSEVEF